MFDTTKNKILNGNLTIYQPKNGFRIGLDSILLGASVGHFNNCIELGSGVGAVTLFLAKRFPKSKIVGIEKNSDLIDLAKKNVSLNNFDNLKIEYFCEDIKNIKSLSQLNNSFDRVVMNPPYFDGNTVLKSTNKMSSQAKYENEINKWFEAAYRKLKPRGYLNFIFRAEYLNIVINCMKDKWGDIKVYPLWPKVDKYSKLLLIQAKKNAKTGVNLLPGLVLHNNDGTYTETCNKILNNKSYINID